MSADVDGQLKKEKREFAGDISIESLFGQKAQKNLAALL